MQPAVTSETQDALTAYGELVREFHDTLDLVAGSGVDSRNCWLMPRMQLSSANWRRMPEP